MNNNIDIKEYDTLFRLNCVHAYHYDNDSDSYGSLNDSDSADSQDTENYFRQNNDSSENEYLQEPVLNLTIAMTMITTVTH